MADDAPEIIELYGDANVRLLRNEEAYLRHGIYTYLRVDDRIAYVGVYPGRTAERWLHFRALVQAILDGEMGLETNEPPESGWVVWDYSDWMDEHYWDDNLEPRQDRPLLERTWSGEELETTPLERALRELMKKHPDRKDTIQLASELTGFDFDEIARRLPVGTHLDGPKEQNGRVMMALLAHI